MSILKRLGLAAAAAVMLLGAGATAAMADCVQWVTVNNNSVEDIYHIYVNNDTGTGWSPDLLGSDVLPAVGGSTRINLYYYDSTRYRYYTIRVVYRNGAAQDDFFDACSYDMATFPHK